MVFITLFLGFGALAAQEPVVYLTLMHDPSTSIVVHWIENVPGVSRVEYRRLGDIDWSYEQGFYGDIAGRTSVHAVELDDLQPNTDYEFQIAEQGNIYKFRTLPQTLARPVHIVMGGDAYFSFDLFHAMNTQIAALAPDFVVVGGDIAYSNGLGSFFMGQKYALNRWLTFFKEWHKSMITPEGRMIPIVPVVGNHDVRRTMLDRSSPGFFYDQFFAFPYNGISYYTLDVGNYLSLFLLDTGHINRISGAQTKWLAQELAKRENRPYKIASYHVGAYPSYYAYTSSVPEELRRAWVPLFERYHISTAFEHHSHTYKRTFPLKGGKIDPDGVVYLGDGSWGVIPRKPKEAWYLQKVAQVNLVYSLILSEKACEITAIDNKGKSIDSLTIQPTRSFTVCEEKLLKVH